MTPAGCSAVPGALSETWVLVRGAGDLATGVIHRLYRAGFRLICTELPEPRAVRRSVAFAECVFRREWEVEGVTAVLARSPAEAVALQRAEPARVPVLIDPDGSVFRAIRDDLAPPVLVDARMAKRNLGTTLSDAPLVIGLGPGFEAGRDVHAVIETARGHELGRVIYRGRPKEFTGVPGEVGGFSAERVLRAPAGGVLRVLAELGDRVEAGQAVAEVLPGPVPVRAAITGVLRGLLRDGAPVRAGQKAGDVDPRLDPTAIHLISDKARAVGGGVLEAILCLRGGRPPATGLSEQ